MTLNGRFYSILMNLNGRSFCLSLLQRGFEKMDKVTRTSQPKSANESIEYTHHDENISTLWSLWRIMRMTFLFLLFKDYRSANLTMAQICEIEMSHTISCVAVDQL